MNFKDENGIWQSILLEPSGDTFPIGAIARWAGDTAPNYWLFADGSNVSRSTYNDLFEKIGTKFGEGDGSTTFGLPSIPDEDNFKFIIKAFQSIGVAGTLTEDINTTSPSDVLTAKKTKEYIDNAVSGVFIGDVKEAPDTVKLVVEPVEQDNVVQGKDLTINNTIENVAKAKVYGYTRQITTTGKNLFKPIFEKYKQRQQKKSPKKTSEK